MGNHYISSFLQAGDGLEISRLWARQGIIADSEKRSIGSILDDHFQEGIIYGGFVRKGDNGEILVYGLNSFVDDETRNRILLRPAPYQGIRFLQDHAKGKPSRFLGVEAQAKGNRSEGLNALSVDYWQKSFDMNDPEFSRAMNAFLPIFLDMFNGFNTKTITFEADTSHDSITREIGYTERYDHSTGNRAHYHVRRSDETNGFHQQMIRMAMVYRRPRMRFSLFEQKIMRAALAGRTDQEIAALLDVSRDAVKQCWRGIYTHAAEMVPGFFGTSENAPDPTRRGPEKRRILLAHIRDNIQELRPYSLRRNSGG